MCRSDRWCPAASGWRPARWTTPPSTTTADGQIAVLPGRGLYAVAGDGNVTFYPLAGVTGLAFTSYTVLDANGTKEYAGLSVRVS